MTLLDPHEADYDPRIHCFICGYPKSAHGGLDGSWQDEARANWTVIVASSADGVEAIERLIGAGGPEWFVECKRLMDAEVDMVQAAARMDEWERAEEAAAEAANRAWEEGRL